MLYKLTDKNTLKAFINFVHNLLLKNGFEIMEQEILDNYSEKRMTLTISIITKSVT